MKVYTEIVYTWDSDKNKLVEESSKSFDYEGPVTQCHKKWYPHSHSSLRSNFGGTTGQVMDKLHSNVTDLAKDNKLDKPGGDVKRFTDWSKSVSQKGELLLWGHSSADSPSKPSGDDSEQLLASSRKTRLGPGREGEDKDSDERRGLVNMSMGTLLTQGQKAKKLPTA